MTTDLVLKVRVMHYQPDLMGQSPSGTLTLTGESLLFHASRKLVILRTIYSVFPGFRKLLSAPDWSCRTQDVTSLSLVDNPLGPPLAFGEVVKVELRGGRSEIFWIKDPKRAIQKLRSFLQSTGNSSN